MNKKKKKKKKGERTAKHHPPPGPPPCQPLERRESFTAIKSFVMLLEEEVIRKSCFVVGVFWFEDERRGHDM